MYKLIFSSLAFVALVLSCHSSTGSSVDPNSHSIQDARNAYFQMDHKKAYQVFENVLADQSQKKEDQASAGRSLAKMDWLFYQDSEKALSRLEQLLNIAVEHSALYNLKARILAAEGRFDDAVVASKKAIELGSSETEKYVATLGLSAHILSKYQSQILDGNTGLSIGEEVKTAYKSLQALASEKPGDVDIAKLYLGFALLLEEGNAAFDAWMSFFRLTDISQVHTSLLKDAAAFQNVLSGYLPGKTTNDVAKRVIKGLAESGFYDYALMVKNNHFGTEQTDDVRINEMVQYHAFVERISDVTQDFYYKTIAGSQKQKTYRNAMIAEAEKFWEELSWEAKAPKFSDEAFVGEMEKRFKAIITFIPANGYYGLHMGHIVLDDRKMINQYSESAEFRYIAIDHMVSNGYSGWFWDGMAESGGWASNDGSFLQVRSAYTSGPVNAWLMVTDPVEMKKVEDNIKELSAKDDSLASIDPHRFLPGLSLRITYNERKALLKSLTDTGLEGGALRLAYINATERIVQGASIYAHEGRHAIDKKNKYSKSSPELEFTAKLSEIYFSEMPMLSFKAIMSRNIGDNTSHGKANLRVVKNLVEWMEAHKAEIDGFDSSRPTLPQLDKLTDAQLKEMAKSYDPMAQ